MKIQFCDLCSESVPDADFSLGRAFRRQGRVVCAACDSAMSTERSDGGSGGESVPRGRTADATRLSAGVGPGSLRPMGLAPEPTEAGAPRGGNPVGTLLSMAALLAVLGGGTFLWSEVQTLQAANDSLRRGVSGDLMRLSADLDSFSLKGQRHREELDDRLTGSLVENKRAFVGTNEELTAEVTRVNQRLKILDGSLEELRLAQASGLSDSGRRMDEFMAQSMKTRVELKALGQRLGLAEGNLVQDQINASAAAAATQKALPYAAQLVDLKSDVAGVRWNAVSSLGEMGDATVVPHLIPVLKDSNSFVRMAVARVFGDLNSALAIEPLIDALEDEEAVVREAAMAALHLITGRDFRFDPYAKDADRKKRVGAWRSWWAKSSKDFVGNP